jgi:phosphoribosylanthranilate isomerase
LRTRVKICGITRLEDALTAIACGADALGFVFVKKSKRYLSPKSAQEIIQKLPSFVSVVALVMDPEVDEIMQIHNAVDIDYWQFHGAETVSFCDDIANKTQIKYIKAVPVGGLSGKKISQNFVEFSNASSLLLDGHAAGKLGGSGEQADWELLAKSLSSDDISKIILAGGLRPDNIALALEKIQPYAIDLSSGVEDSPGIKSRAKIKALFAELTKSDAEKVQH